MQQRNRDKIEVSYRTLLFPFFVLGGVWLFTQIWDILLLIFVAFLLMTALRPIALGIEKLGLPRIASSLIVYGFIIFIISFLIAEIVPSLVSQTSKFILILPSLLNKALPITNSLGIDPQSITGQIAPLGQGVVRVTFELFANVFSFIALLVFSFYFLMERAKAEYYLELLMGEKAGGKAYTILLAVEERLGAWVRGQIVLMLFVFLTNYIGLLLLRVEFALPLALLAGLLELIPIIGPISAGVIAVIVALSSSPFLAISVAALYFIVQQVQNTLIVPFVMSKSIGISPILTIVALLIGSRFLGLGAAILTIPMFLVIQVIIRSLITLKTSVIETVHSDDSRQSKTK